MSERMGQGGPCARSGHLGARGEGAGGARLNREQACRTRRDALTLLSVYPSGLLSRDVARLLGLPQRQKTIGRVLRRSQEALSVPRGRRAAVRWFHVVHRAHAEAYATRLGTTPQGCPA